MEEIDPDDPILNKDHVKWCVISLAEDFTVDTTLAVYCLNPPTSLSKVPDEILNVLKEKGYTRLYILYLFSRVGDFSEHYTRPLNELVDERCNEIIPEFISDIGKFIFAYGDSGNPEMMGLVDQRVADVKRRIHDVKPDIPFYAFGELSSDGHPKSLHSITPADIEISF